MRDALIVEIVSWVAQFIGHGFAEGRAPALLDNIAGGEYCSLGLGCMH